MAAVAFENYPNLLEMEVGTGGVEVRQLSSTHLSIRKRKRVGVAVQKLRRGRHMFSVSRRIVYVEAINGS